MVAPVSVAGRRVGPGHPCFIIAEAGVNHNGQLPLARRLMEAAAAAGADAVKFQTFKADRVVTASAPKARYQRQGTETQESQLEMLRRLELSEDAHRALWDDARARGLTVFSTPLEEASADFLETLDVPAFKIPSGEVTNLPFLAHVARKGRPLIVSTGMSTLEEVAAAMAAIRGAGNDAVILLHCVSCYPAAAAAANLRAMRTMAEAFGVPVGYSDHTEGLAVAWAAVALGACVIEKHFTLDRALPGPDHRASLEPQELTALVAGIRRIEAAMGDGRKIPAAGEAETAAVARKSLVAAAAIPAGRRVTAAAVVIRRPGTGLPPSALPHVVGRTAAQDIPAGTMLAWEMLA